MGVSQKVNVGAEGTGKRGAGRGCILLPSLQMILEKSGWGVAEGDSDLVVCVAVYLFLPIIFFSNLRIFANSKKICATLM